jgi:hypothetical protein
MRFQVTRSQIRPQSHVERQVSDANCAMAAVTVVFDMTDPESSHALGVENASHMLEFEDTNHASTDVTAGASNRRQGWHGHCEYRHVKRSDFDMCKTLHRIMSQRSLRPHIDSHSPRVAPMFPSPNNHACDDLLSCFSPCTALLPAPARAPRPPAPPPPPTLPRMPVTVSPTPPAPPPAPPRSPPKPPAAPPAAAPVPAASVPAAPPPPPPPRRPLRAPRPPAPEAPPVAPPSRPVRASSLSDGISE